MMPVSLSRFATDEPVVDQGNYMSTLFFGTTLDRYGPRMTAILASILFSLGLVLCR